MEVIHTIAVNMDKRYTYLTEESDVRCFAKFLGVSADGERVGIKVLVARTGHWKVVEVPPSYKVRTLTEREAEEFLGLGQGKYCTGKMSGKTMYEVWAYYIHKYVDEYGGRTKTVDAMVAEFPYKEANIRRQVDRYLGYYNTGRMEKYGYPRQKVGKRWVLTPLERAYGAKDIRIVRLAPKMSMEEFKKMVAVKRKARLEKEAREKEEKERAEAEQQASQVDQPEEAIDK